MIFVLGIVAVVRTEKRGSLQAIKSANLLTLLLVMKICGLIVAVTGGPSSKFTGILYVPIFLAALFYSLPGSVLAGASAASFILLFTLPGTSFAVKDQEGALTLAGVFLLVSLIAGIFSQRLTYAARQATRRAQAQQQRAAEFEWFMDTSVMMESLQSLETMLSAALLRLQELIPCDTAAVFLRDYEGLEMQLVEYSSNCGEKPVKFLLTHEEQEPLRLAGYTVASWSDSTASAQEMGAFCDIVPGARSVMAATLRTLDDVFGAIIVTAKEPGAFTERHRELLLQFARHVVYPIQRIRLQALSVTDILTGLNNQRAFRGRIKDEVKRSQRYGHPLSLILLDLDHFKRVNDTLGHPAGDAILSQVGAMLRRRSRGSDFVARYGGEEMAVLCPETRPEEALILAERIREAIAGRTFTLPDGGKHHITVSLGIASLPANGSGESMLVEAADQALYAAKSRGRDQVQIAGSPARLVAKQR
ncbi:MAG: diguanylate cyclase [Cytophagales bacterium]|nr:diguanylate cyclase [Armatimonadota bacterium]